HEDISVAGNGHDLGGRISRWVRRIYLALIFVVVGAMFVHNALLFHKKVAAHLRASGRPVLRMSLSQRWQHAVLALSFITLAVTGFALKFPDSGLAQMLGSSEPVRRWIHRIAGIVLLLTGLMIWFKLDVTRFLPRWAVDVALTIHYYEAVLACLAIVVWHFYHVIFDPDVYPLNTACLDGRISEELQAHEHPLEISMVDPAQNANDSP
ncbi:MAG TPA: hypothetical protein VF430_04315, partial [Verrucomicrobiae bacterium]